MTTQQTTKRQSNQADHQLYKAAFERFLDTRQQPFTAKHVEQNVGCSRRTAYRLINRYYSGVGAWRPKSGIFVFYHSPKTWGHDDLLAWLRSINKSGKTKAAIFNVEADPTHGN